MIKKIFNYISLTFVLLVYSCTGVQEYVFPSLSDEEVAAPPALDEVPAAVQDVNQQVAQEIPPSQYAPPPTMTPPQVVNDTGPTGTFVGGKINHLSNNKYSKCYFFCNNDFLRFRSSR